MVSHSEDEPREKFSRRHALSMPAIIIGGNSVGFDAPVIREDDQAAGEEAAKHLLSRGHRNFAWLNLYHGNVARDRREGFRRTIEQSGLRCTILERRVRSGPKEGEVVRRWLRASLKLLPKPIALFVVDDQMAADVIDICLEAGVRVPEEVAVMGVGNIELACELSQVPISTVEFDFQRLGFEAAELLAQAMKGKPIRRLVKIPPARVIARKSTEIVVAEDPRLKAAVQFMAENLHRSFGMDEIASRSGISRRMLHHLFNRDLHCSPARYLLRSRLEKAKQMLEVTDEKIASIAQNCGLLSSRNIDRCFVREVGMSPHAYRQSFARNQP